jgi:hypothetical protein
LEIAQHCVGNPGASSDCVTDYSNYSYFNSIEQAFNERMAEGFLIRQDGLKLFSLRTNETIITNSHVFTVKFDYQSGKSVELKTQQIVLK